MGGGDEIILITQKVMDVKPRMYIFWIGFVFFGSIALTDLVPSIFVVLNLQQAEHLKQETQAAEWQQKVKEQRIILEKLFKLADVDASDTVSRQELESLLQ